MIITAEVTNNKHEPIIAYYLLREFRASAKGKYILLSFDINKVIGKVIEAYIDSYSLYIKATMDSDYIIKGTKQYITPGFFIKDALYNKNKCLVTEGKLITLALNSNPAEKLQPIEEIV